MSWKDESSLGRELRERQTHRRVYLIRHGSTEMNSEDRIRGQCNVPLSAEGREEIARLAGLLRESNIQFLVSSDLDRAVETAEAVARTRGASLAKSASLRPWDVGEFTGRPAEAVTPRLIELAKYSPNTPVKGGESFNSFKQRAFAGFRLALAATEAPLALVSHHRVERLLSSWLSAGAGSDLELDLDLMFTRGEPPAHAELVELPLAALEDLGRLPGALAGESAQGPSSADGSLKEAGSLPYA
jgi:2,3-bisphosphoglycerate-dependent phosphoglycerate mutase